MHKSATFAKTDLLAYILAVTLVGESMCRAEIFRSACRNDATFKFTQKEKMLVGTSSIVVSEIFADRLSWCSKHCIHSPQCLSFNYKKHASGASKNCQLLSAAQATSGTSFTSATGWVHYEPIAQAPPRCRFVTCNAGYVCKSNCSILQGYKCVDIDECVSSPCLNGATCNNLVNSYSCTCAGGYTGTNCEADINECASNPCVNGATCSNNLNFYSCTCTGGYTGTNCESDINECLSSPCKNGGTCNNEINQYSCTCLPFFISALCETNFDSATEHFTSYSDTEGGKLVFLDRQHPLCGTNSYMRGFKMESSGDQIRYRYQCINLKQSICTNSVKYGAYDDHGDGNSHFIDRFPVDCLSDGYVYGFQFENPNNGNARYKVECCTVQSSWTSAATCYSSSTTPTDYSNADVNFLDRQEIWCNSGYALSYFRYINVNSHTQLKIDYRCCKIYA